MRLIAVFFMLSMLMAGCVNQPVPKYPPLAKGRWQDINQSGFIPPNVTVYKRLPILQDELTGVESSDIPTLAPQTTEYPNAEVAVVDVYQGD